MLINDLIMIDQFLITNYFHFSQNKNGLPLQDLMKWKKKYLNQKKILIIYLSMYFHRHI
jgi:hypothetical protein